MNPELWRRAEAVFHAALERSPETRTEFLAEACSNDAELRRQVDMLLSGDERAGSLFEGAVLGDVATADVATTPHNRGTLVGGQYGQYRILSLLGAGGMGEVYRAHDGRLGRDVALKILPSEFAGTPDRLARFRREARTLASLNHPNIAAIHGLEESGGLECLVLELVEGETLAGPLSITQALEYARQLADALEAAHRKGIIHRDLKPANVKVTPEGTLKVLDFGLAKALSGPDPKPDLSLASTGTGIQTIVGHMVGTPGYMSPEQARGTDVDERTDIWAFGCLLYELLTGTRAFVGATLPDTIAAVLEREPDWRSLPAKTPAKIRELLRNCLQKDGARRLRTIADARAIIKDAQRGRNRWRVAAMIAAVPVAAILAAVIWLLTRPVITDRSQWVQITKFPDSVGQPALSPDGRMLAFMRSDSAFLGEGQVYIKRLPDGEPVQLTHDSISKEGPPTFSPDGSRVAYGTFSPDGFMYDTWVVPTMGGEAKPWLENASGLTWTAPRQVLFSEMKIRPHMGIVLANDDRTGSRDVYLPAEQPSMAHRSYLSPDGKWVLVVEMDPDHLWLPCRVVPLDGSSAGQRVGPLRGGCTAGAWSPDGTWIYMTSTADGTPHIWRQRFPDGKPEQITSGPTEEEGIAMVQDGRSFITAVALRNTSLWVHDAKGERGISVEGNAAQPRFTPDGKKLLYRIVTQAPNEYVWYRDPGGIEVADLESGRSEPLAPGFHAVDYDISSDGRQVVMQVADKQGKSRLWYVPMDRSASPRQIPDVEGVSPRFGPDGEVFFRHYAGTNVSDTSGNVFRVRLDGTGLRKALETPVLLMSDISPDGRWLGVWAPLPDGRLATQLLPLDGGSPVTLNGNVSFKWSSSGRALSITAVFGIISSTRSYLISLPPGQMIPPIPAGGFHSEKELAGLVGAQRLDARSVVPGPSPDVYAFFRGATQRNLYRVPIH
jgi:serine/threonine protein kinase